jgi:hypothetical protein
MRPMGVIALLAIALALPSVGAAGDPLEVRRTNNVTDHRTSVVTDHRTNKVTDHRKLTDGPAGNSNRVHDHRDRDLGPTALTRGECTKLGGKVSRNTVCGSSSGKACYTTDRFGKTHAVCISEVASSGSGRTQKPSSSPFPTGVIPPPAPHGNAMATPLTSQECEGLGGTVRYTTKCGNAGQKACMTVDKYGVIRVACINKVAK